MDTLQVKKIVAVCFLEAVRVSLEHIRSHRMAMASQNVEGSDDLPKLYGDVRRLRDYLQRCAGISRDMVEVDLDDGDPALLVACCKRFVEAIDVRLGGPDVTDAKERQLLLKKQQLVTDWAIELAEKPLYDLPIPRMIELPGEGSRVLKLRLQKKLFATGEQRLIRQGKTLPVNGDDRESHTDANHGASTGTVPVIDLVEAVADRAVATAPEPRPALLDPATLHDPRLRALVGLDLRSFEMAQQAKDHRIASLMLAAILEAAVVDHAIRHRHELELSGGPDTWDPLTLVLQILGEDAAATEQSLACSLLAARNLLSPAHQMISPLVVTSASVDGHRGFVESVLHQLGFAGRSRRVEAL